MGPILKTAIRNYYLMIIVYFCVIPSLLLIVTNDRLDASGRLFNLYQYQQGLAAFLLAFSSLMAIVANGFLGILSNRCSRLKKACDSSLLKKIRVIAFLLVIVSIVLSVIGYAQSLGLYWHSRDIWFQGNSPLLNWFFKTLLAALIMYPFFDRASRLHLFFSCLLALILILYTGNRIYAVSILLGFFFLLMRRGFFVTSLFILFMAPVLGIFSELMVRVRTGSSLALSSLKLPSSASDILLNMFLDFFEGGNIIAVTVMYNITNKNQFIFGMDGVNSVISMMPASWTESLTWVSNKSSSKFVADYIYFDNDGHSLNITLLFDAVLNFGILFGPIIFFLIIGSLYWTAVNSRLYLAAAVNLGVLPWAFRVGIDACLILLVICFLVGQMEKIRFKRPRERLHAVPSSRAEARSPRGSCSVGCECYLVGPEKPPTL